MISRRQPFAAAGPARGFARLLASTCLAAAVTATAGLAMASTATTQPAAAQPAAAQPIDQLASLTQGAAPTAEQLPGLEARLRETVERVRPAVVGLTFGRGGGSGVIVTPDGYILTAAHVIGPPGRRITVLFEDGTSAPARTLGVNLRLDAGLVKLEGEGPWPFVRPSRDTELRPGQWAFAMGHPGGFQAERGAPLRLGRVLDDQPTGIVSDCMLVHGDSGGPMFDLDGEVIGIHSRIGGTLMANVHVPIEAFTGDWDRLVAGEAWGARGPQRGGPWMGVRGDGDPAAARIAAVVAGSPAAKAGLQAGDVIVRFADQPIESFEELAKAVRATSPGDLVPMVVERDGESVELALTVGRFDPRARRRAPSTQPADPEAEGSGEPQASDPENGEEGEGGEEGEEGSASDRGAAASPDWMQRMALRIDDLHRFERLREVQPIEINHDAVLDAFRDAVAAASASTVQVLGDGEPVALGTVVDSAGHVLTKASELRGGVEVLLPTGTRTPAEVIGVSDAYDLALLRVQAEGLTAVRWSEQPPAVGALLATPGADGKPVAIGVVSVAARPMHARGFLGVSLGQTEPDDEADTPRISAVVPDTAAARAGLKRGDLILMVDGQKVETNQAVVEIISHKRPGDEIALAYQRDGQNFVVKLELGRRLTGASAARFNRTNMIGGELSDRRSDFPSVVQHDTRLLPEQVGGPIVGLSGEAIGVNIARAGRVKSFALPADAIQALIAEMIDGKHPPSEELARQLEIRAIDEQIHDTTLEIYRSEAARDAAEATGAEAARRLEQLEQRREALQRADDEDAGDTTS